MKPIKAENLKKVYVATFVDWNNYGSVLQAFAFKNTLLKLGYSSEIIEAKSAPTYKSEFGRKVRSIREAFAHLDFLLNKKKPNRDLIKILSLLMTI